MKKILIIIAVLIAGIVITLAVILYNAPNMSKMRKDIYAVVIHNNSDRTIKNMELIIEDISDNSFIHSNEINIIPGEFRKINVDIHDPRLKMLSGSYNVQVICEMDNQQVVNSMVGYFTCEYGGFALLTMNNIQGDYNLKPETSGSSKLFNKMKKRHIENPFEYTWQ